MLKQALIVLGILLAFGCADVPTGSEQFATGGCSEGSDSVGENQYVTPDTTPPTISSPPTSGATDVSVSSDITIPFSEGMDSSTINSTNITVVDNSSNVVSGVWSYSGTTATFNPSSDLSFSTTYTVAVGTGVKDSAGNSLGASSSWAFTTENPYPIDITAGNNHNCALMSDSTVRCWGNNLFGQLGDGSTTDRTSPVRVTPLFFVEKVATKNLHTCAILSDQSARCWGYAGYGQLGDGSSAPTTSVKLSPVEPLYNRKFLQISLGNAHSCGVLTDYSAQCWGMNFSGQIGNNSTAHVNYPTGVSLLNKYYYPPSLTSIAAGDKHSCAILSDGTAKCWGDNSFGQLGDGTKSQRTIPTAVSALTNISTLSLGALHSCALLSDQTVMCWGRNNLGQLGNGALVDSLVAIDLTSLSSVSKITTGYHHNCALLSDQTVMCWGDNYYGQLGNGKSGGTDPNHEDTTVFDDGIDSSIPTQINSLSGVSSIACGFDHTCALLEDRTVKCWGRNSFGQLGNGTTNNSATPVTVQF